MLTWALPSVGILSPDLLELDAPLPDPLPPHLALTLTSSTMKLTFASIPSIADGSTHVVRCLPWSTAATLVEDVCDRHGLVRRLTLGGETRSRGKDKWGGGTPVEYVLEELWADGRGLEREQAPLISPVPASAQEQS